MMSNPVCGAVTGSQRELAAKLPVGLTPLVWPDIKPGLDTQTRYISGQVIANYQLVRGHRPQKKILLQEVNCSNGPHLTVFLLWDYAEQCQTIQDGAIIFLNNVHVEKCVRPTARSHPSQLMAGVNHSLDARIWFTHSPTPVMVVPPQPVASTSQSRPAAATVNTRPAPGGTTGDANQSLTVGGGAAAAARSYQYTEMKDVKPDSSVNIYGVVKFARRPMRTNGTDYMSVVTVVDPSSVDNSGAISLKLKCNLFHRDISKLPDVKIGDIVRFHRLKVVRFRGDLQGQNGAGFSWLAWEGNPGASLIPKSSNPSYTFTDAAKDKVIELQTWSQNQGFEARSIPKNELLFSQIHPTLYFDLLCQVVASGCLEPGVCWLLRVWDGTVPIYPLRDITNETDDVVLQEDAELCAKSHGYACDVYIFDDHFGAACIIKPGDFVKLYNLHAAVLKSTEVDQEDFVQTIELCLHRGRNYGRGLEIMKDGPHLADLKMRLNSAAQKDRMDRSLPAVSQQDNLSQLNTGDRQTVSQIVLGGINRNMPDDAISGTSGYVAPRNIPPQNEPGDQTPRTRIAETNQNVQKGNNRQSGKAASFEELFEELRSCSPKKKRSGTGTQQRSRRSQRTTLELTSTPSSSSEPRRCMQQTGTAILGHYNVKTTSISDIISHKVPFNFRVTAKVLGYQPMVETAEEFLRLFCPKCHFLSPLPADGGLSAPRGSTDASSIIHLSDWRKTAKAKHVQDGMKYYDCPQCSLDVSIKTRSQEIPDVPELRYIYMIDFLLGETDGGWLKVLLWGSEAVKFFHDDPPEHLLRSKEAYASLIKKLNRLLPTGNNGEQMTVECCVKSFSNDGVWYNMFDTVLSLDSDDDDDDIG